MSRPTSASKRKYNKSAYHRYEFSVKLDTRLNYLLEEYKGEQGNSLSELIKCLLGQHFGVDVEEVHIPYHLQKIHGEWVQI